MIFGKEKYQVKIFVDAKGNTPFIEWLESIDINTRARIKNQLRKIEFGNFGDWKYLGKGIFEIRMDFGQGYRVYWGRAGKVVVLLFCGGNKKSQKKDIEKAGNFFNEYKINSK